MEKGLHTGCPSIHLQYYDTTDTGYFKSIICRDALYLLRNDGLDNDTFILPSIG